MLHVSIAGRQKVTGRREVAGFLARESSPALVGCAFVALVAALVPQLVASDGWLALVGGRWIVEHGLPGRNTLTVVGEGRQWIDQQWLGQLTLYGLHAMGGLRLLLAANVALVAGAFAAAMVYARKRGGEAATVAVVSLVALVPYLVTATNVRTQSLVYLPFVALIALLSDDGRLSRRRVVLVLALLVLWANVHGSVLLAAARLVSLRGVHELIRT